MQEQSYILREMSTINRFTTNPSPEQDFPGKELFRGTGRLSAGMFWIACGQLEVGSDGCEGQMDTTTTTKGLRGEGEGALEQLILLDEQTRSDSSSS